MTTSSKKEFRGVWMSKEIFLDKQLSMTEKFVLAIIEQYESNKGCDFSNKCFSEILNCSQSSLARAISKLKDLGYITQVQFDGRERSLKKIK